MSRECITARGGGAASPGKEQGFCDETLGGFASLPVRGCRSAGRMNYWPRSSSRARSLAAAGLLAWLWIDSADAAEPPCAYPQSILDLQRALPRLSNALATN